MQPNFRWCGSSHFGKWGQPLHNFLTPCFVRSCDSHVTMYSLCTHTYVHTYIGFCQGKQAPRPRWVLQELAGWRTRVCCLWLSSVTQDQCNVYLNDMLYSHAAVEIVGMAMATDVQTSFKDAISKLQLCAVWSMMSCHMTVTWHGAPLYSALCPKTRTYHGVVTDWWFILNCYPESATYMNPGWKLPLTYQCIRTYVCVHSNIAV